MGGRDEDKVRLEKTSLKSRFKKTRRKEEQCTQRREKEASRELARDKKKDVTFEGPLREIEININTSDTP